MELALFDLDNTLLAGDSDHAWGQFLCDQGVVDRDRYKARNDAFYEQYKAGTLDIFELLDFILQPLAQIPRAELDALHEQFMGQIIRPMILAKGRALVAEHLQKGHLCAIVTATNAFVTAPIAREFNVPHLIATIPAQQNGAFTGAPRGVPSFKEGKITRVQEWLESMAMSLQSFSRSYFYSDSHNDLPLLLKVTDPQIVDPDDTLRAYAQTAGWLITSLR